MLSLIEHLFDSGEGRHGLNPELRGHVARQGEAYARGLHEGIHGSVSLGELIIPTVTAPTHATAAEPIGNGRPS